MAHPPDRCSFWATNYAAMRTDRNWDNQLIWLNERKMQVPSNCERPEMNCYCPIMPESRNIPMILAVNVLSCLETFQSLNFLIGLIIPLRCAARKLSTSSLPRESLIPQLQFHIMKRKMDGNYRKNFIPKTSLSMIRWSEDLRPSAVLLRAAGRHERSLQMLLL